MQASPSQRRSLLVPFIATLLAAAVPACASDASSTLDESVEAGAALVDASALDWSPGHYLLLRSGEPKERDAALGDASVRATYKGLQIKYVWDDMEGPTAGDYTKGFARLDADLQAAAARGMKVIIQLQTKTFTGAGGGGDAVPAYLRAPVSPYCVGTGPSVCGQYAMGNGLTAMLWLTPVRQRLNALVAALGARYSPLGARADLAGAIAAFALPETANEEGPVSLAHVGYTQQGVVDAVKSVLLATRRAFPSRLAFQYINFLPPNGSARPYLRQIADFALATPGVGLGCPDLSPTKRAKGIPGYDVLFDPAYAHVPKNPSVQAPDLNVSETSGVKATMDLGRLALPAGMSAEYVTWYNGTGSAITPRDIVAEVARRGPITDPKPTYP